MFYLVLAQADLKPREVQFMALPKLEFGRHRCVISAPAVHMSQRRGQNSVILARKKQVGSADRKSSC